MDERFPGIFKTVAGAREGRKWFEKVAFGWQCCCWPACARMRKRCTSWKRRSGGRTPTCWRISQRQADSVADRAPLGVEDGLALFALSEDEVRELSEELDPLSVSPDGQAVLLSEG